MHGVNTVGQPHGETNDWADDVLAKLVVIDAHLVKCCKVVAETGDHTSASMSPVRSTTLHFFKVKY